MKKAIRQSLLLFGNSLRIESRNNSGSSHRRKKAGKKNKMRPSRKKSVQHLIDAGLFQDVYGEIW